MLGVFGDNSEVVDVIRGCRGDINEVGYDGRIEMRVTGDIKV